MSKVIVYPTGDNTFAVVSPILECGIPLNEIARKDVPASLPYLIIEANTLTDTSQFDFSTPDGIGIGSQAWFAEQNQITQGTT
jgi:hypothetical protein